MDLLLYIFQRKKFMLLTSEIKAKMRKGFLLGVRVPAVKKTKGLKKTDSRSRKHQRPISPAPTVSSYL